jgi:hypothetical protein
VREQKKFRESIADITEVSVAAVIIVAINSSGKRRKLLALADKLFVDVVIGASDDFSASTIIDSLKTTSNGEFVYEAYQSKFHNHRLLLRYHPHHHLSLQLLGASLPLQLPLLL